MKKTFVMYMSWQPLFDNLSDEDAGQMIRVIYKYQATGDMPNADWKLYPTFMMLKATIDEDTAKYKEKVERLANNRNQDDINVKSERNQDDIALVATDTDTDTDTDTSSKKKIKATETDIRILDYFNSKCNTSYRYKNQEILKLIHGRLKDGFSEDDFKRVIDIKYEEWFDNPDMAKYLKPSTLFRPSHFEEYLNQKTKGEPKTRSELIDEQMKDW